MKTAQLACLALFSTTVLGLPLNSPYHTFEKNEKIGLQSISSIPPFLDPIKAYDSESIYLINQIYEPLYTFEFMKKPYRVVPLIAASMPKIEFYNRHHQKIQNENREDVYQTVYTIPIKHGIYYQPHPGFCDEENTNCSAFRRELSADDYVYQILRIAQPYSHSPMTSLLRRYVVGFKEYMDNQKNNLSEWYDFSSDHIEGFKSIDPYTLQMTLKGNFSQWIYWLTMGFFSPLPWEVDWYQQQHPEQNQWKIFSIGTGPYMFYQNDSFRNIVLKRNPNYREDFDYLNGIKRKLPIIDKFIFSIEKETIPKWNKFLQGYYDTSFIPAESFENSMQFNQRGDIKLSGNLLKKGMELHTEMANSTSGLGFNMNDPLVGGYSEKSKKLRRAIGIAFDFDEYLSIFRNGRGVLAYGPIPPNIEGYVSQEQAFKKNIQYAKKLLAEAGYPNGINPRTHQHLVIHFDVVSRGLPEEKAVLAWFRKQMAKIGIVLNVREYDKNRYERKLNSGDLQTFFYVWIADYPDSENFLMLFYGPNRKMKHGGENLSNFSYPPYDKLFRQLQFIRHEEDRRQIISKMVNILQEQGVWAWAIHGENFYISQKWLNEVHFPQFTMAILKHMDVDTSLRTYLWMLWNKANLKPVLFIIALMFIFVFPFYLENKKIKAAKARRNLIC